MRVLQLISSSAIGGAESVVLLLASELAALSAEVTVGVLHTPKSQPPALLEAAQGRGLRVLDLPCTGRLSGRTLLTLVRFLRRGRIDVLHTHGYKANAYGLLAARLSGCRLLATCHNWTDRTAALRRYRALDLHLLRRFPRVIAVSPSVAATLSRHGFPAARLGVIANGIPTANYRGDPAAAPGPAAPVIGTVARLSPEKGVDVLLRALPRILRERPEVRCLIAGEGPERSALQQLADGLGVASRVTLAGFEQRVAPFLHRCTVVVQPSRLEGLPVAVLEAMAAGRPIVATAVGDVPSLLQHGDAGRLVPPDDPEALAAAVLELLGDPALCLRLGNNAARHAREHFEASGMARTYLETFHALLPTRTRGQIASAAPVEWERAQ